jgi:hypothetical protein
MQCESIIPNLLYTCMNTWVLKIFSGSWLLVLSSNPLFPRPPIYPSSVKWWWWSVCIYQWHMVIYHIGTISHRTELFITITMRTSNCTVPLHCLLSLNYWQFLIKVCILFVDSITEQGPSTGRTLAQVSVQESLSSDIQSQQNLYIPSGEHNEIFLGPQSCKHEMMWWILDDDGKNIGNLLYIYMADCQRRLHYNFNSCHVHPVDLAWETILRQQQQ